MYFPPSKRAYKWIECGYCGEWAVKPKEQVYCSSSCGAKARLERGESNMLSRPLPRKTELSITRYKYLHETLARSLGKADYCDNGCETGPYHWANQTGDYENFSDYLPLCAKCHHRLDRSREGAK
jgi:hypothetical protein